MSPTSGLLATGINPEITPDIRRLAPAPARSPGSIAGTDSCQVEHIGYVLEGRMALRMDNGTEREFGPGDTFHMPPGHDAWTVGDERCVLLDFGGLNGYAESS